MPFPRSLLRNSCNFCWPALRSAHSRVTGCFSQGARTKLQELRNGESGQTKGATKEALPSGRTSPCIDLVDVVTLPLPIPQQLPSRLRILHSDWHTWHAWHDTHLARLARHTPGTPRTSVSGVHVLHTGPGIRTTGPRAHGPRTAGEQPQTSGMRTTDHGYRSAAAARRATSGAGPPRGPRALPARAGTWSAPRRSAQKDMQSGHRVAGPCDSR